MIYLAVIVVSYGLFVFFGEHLNPFIKPRAHVRRRRWRFGRAVFWVTLFVGLATAYAGSVTELTAVHQTLIFAVASAAILWPWIRRHFKSRDEMQGMTERRG